MMDVCVCVCVCVCVYVLSHFSWVQLFATIYYSDRIHGILQAGKLEWIVMPSSRVSFLSKDQTRIFYLSCIDRRVLY